MNDGIFIKKDYISRNKLEFDGIIKQLFLLIEGEIWKNN